MTAVFRPFLALLLAVTLLGATAFEASASLTAEFSTAAEPCCDGGCPDDQACEAACIMMQRCGTAMTALLQSSEPTAIAAPVTTALFPHEQPPQTGLALHGLKRPPRF